MAKPTGLTDAERARIQELHAAGKSCNAIARDLGRSASTVSKYGREVGLQWGGAPAAAVEATKASNRDRRARLVQRLYTRAETILDRLEADQFKLVGIDKDGYARTNRIDADAIPGGEERALTGMVVNTLVAAARLEQVDAERVNGAEAKGILGNLHDALHQAYGQLAHAGGTPTADDVERELDTQ